MAEPDVDQEEVQRVKGGHYTGPEAHVIAPWKCPACGVEQVGRVELGCPSCGSGKPGVHVGVQQAATPHREVQQGPWIANPAPEWQGAFRTWFQARIAEDGNPWGIEKHEQLLRETFLAGWRAALGQTMQAPPVTVDVTRLAPEGKSYRTLIAALEMFIDGILRQQPEEIASGEWCSVEEAQALIEQLRPGAEG